MLFPSPTSHYHIFSSGPLTRCHYSKPRSSPVSPTSPWVSSPENEEDPHHAAAVVSPYCSGDLL